MQECNCEEVDIGNELDDRDPELARSVLTDGIDFERQ